MTLVKRDSMFMGAVPLAPVSVDDPALPPIGWTKLPDWADGGHINEAGSMLAYLIWRYGAWGVQQAIEDFFAAHPMDTRDKQCSCQDCTRYGGALNNLIAWPPETKG